MKKKISFIFLLTCLILLTNTQAAEITIKKITNVKLHQDKNSSNVIIDLTGPIENLPQIMATLETVTFDLDAVYFRKEAEKQRKLIPQSIEVDGFIKKVSWQTQGNKTTFEIKRKYYRPVNFKKQEKPPALILEFPSKYFLKESKEIKPGIIKHLVRTENNRGPVTSNFLEIDLSNNNVLVKVGIPNKKKIKTKDTLTNLVKTYMAFIGINANYFDIKAGNPLGTLITEGTWLIGPVYDRAAIGFTKDKEVLINQVMLFGHASIFRGIRKKQVGTFEIDGLNTPPHLYEKIGLFTVNWDEELNFEKDKKVVIVKDGCIKKIKKGKAKIPSEGYCLVNSNNYNLDFLKKKDCIKIEWKGNSNWERVSEAISGGPYLLKDGEVFIDEIKQHFKLAKKDIFAPRTAVGIGKDNKLFLVTVDGRRSGYSVGLTLKELAELLKKLNLKDAINLDGGGSTELVLDGEIINKLSERHERKISNALLIIYND